MNNIFYIKNDLFKIIQQDIKEAKKTVTIVYNIWNKDELGNSLANILLELANKNILINIISNNILNNKNSFFSNEKYNVLLSHITNHPNINITLTSYLSSTAYIKIDNEILYIGNIEIKTTNQNDFNFAVKISDKNITNIFNECITTKNKKILNNIEFNFTSKTNEYSIFKSFYKEIYNNNEIVIVSSSNIKKLISILKKQGKSIKFIKYNNYLLTKQLKYPIDIISYNAVNYSFIDLMLINDCLILNFNQPLDSKKYYGNIYIKIKDIEIRHINEIKKNIIDIIY